MEEIKSHPHETTDQFILEDDDNEALRIEMEHLKLMMFYKLRASARKDE